MQVHMEGGKKMRLTNWGAQPGHYMLPGSGDAVNAASVGLVVHEYMLANREHRALVDVAVAAAENGCPAGCNARVWKVWAAALCILSTMVCYSTTGDAGAP